MRIAPREPLPLQSLARLRIEMGQYPAARHLLTTALRASPDDLVTARMLIELESRERKHHPGGPRIGRGTPSLASAARVELSSPGTARTRRPASGRAVAGRPAAPTWDP